MKETIGIVSESKFETDVYWIRLAQWRTVVKTIVNLRVS